MTLSLSRMIARYTGSAPSSDALPSQRRSRGPGSRRGKNGKDRRLLDQVVEIRWQRLLLQGTTFLLTLGVVLLEVSSAALFLGRLQVSALALVYGLTALLGFGLRELIRSLPWPGSRYWSRHWGPRRIRVMTALAWVALVGVWLGLCFGEPGSLVKALPGGAAFAQTLGLSHEAGWLSSGGLPQSLLLAQQGPISSEQSALQVVLLQCGAMLLSQFHRAQVQGATLRESVGDRQPPKAGAIALSRQSPSNRPAAAVSALFGRGQQLLQSPTSQSLAALPLASFTFGAYALVGLVLPWCLGAAGSALPLESVALGSGLLILLGAVPRLILAEPASAGRAGGSSAHQAPGESEEDRLDADSAPPALLRRYGKLLLIFFALGQLLTVLIQWGLWGQLQRQFLGGLAPTAFQAVEIAAFLALLQGVVGWVGLLLQGAIARGWFVGHGAFTALAWSPLVMFALSLLVVQERLPLLLGLALLHGLDQGLHYSLEQYAQGRLLARLPHTALIRLQQQRVVTESLAVGLLGVSLLVGWRSLGQPSSNGLLLLVAGLTLAILIVLALVRYRYFQLILGAIEQQALHRRFPNGPLEQLGAVELLSQPESPLVKRGLVKSLKRALKEPVQLEDAITSVRLLNRLDPWLTVETLAPVLTRLPPMLQLEGLAVMTRLGRAAQASNQAQVPVVDRSGVNSLSVRRYNPQRYGRSVEALMTPIAPPQVFAAALRHSLYLGPAIAPKALQLHLQPARSPRIRAVAAAFALNPLLPVEESGQRSVQDKRNPSHRLAQTQWSDLVPQAQEILRAMLTHEAQEERWAASDVLKDLADLTPFKAQIPALLEDFSPQVREAAIAAIGHTRSQSLYPYLLKALRVPLIEQPAHDALVTLGNAAVPLLQRCTQHPDLSLKTKQRSWCILMEIATPQARMALAEDVLYQQGEARASLLTLLLNPSPEAHAAQASYGAALSQALAGSEGVMQLVREELWLLSHLYAALVELHPKQLPGQAARQLRQALQRQQRDVGERILLLLQIRYPTDRLKQAIQQLRHRSTVDKGLKRLAQLLEPPLREPLLAVFDARPARLKRAAFADWEEAAPCEASVRLQRLIALKPGLQPEALALAYELALEQEITLPDELLLAGINHRHGAVQIAAQAYLNGMPDSLVTELLEAL